MSPLATELRKIVSQLRFARAGGAVITEAGNDPKVKSLVYVAAFVPDANESISDLGRGKPPPAWASSLRADKGGYGWLPVSTVVSAFAQDLPATEAALLAVKQGPINTKNSTRRFGSQPGAVVRFGTCKRAKIECSIPRRRRRWPSART